MDTPDMEWMRFPASPFVASWPPPAAMWPKAPKPGLFLWSGVVVLGFDGRRWRVRVKAGSRPVET